MATTLVAVLSGSAIAGGTTSVGPAARTIAGEGGGIPFAQMSGELQRSVQKAFGDASQDLVFFPVTPCRIVDTRIGGGAIAGMTSRSFSASDSTAIAAQGGVPSGGCGVLPNAAAIMANVAVANPTAAGNYLAYAAGGPQPLTSILNWFGAGNLLSNTTLIPLAASGTPEFTIYLNANPASPGTADLVVDVFGYFTAPNATSLECNNVYAAPVQIAVQQGATLTSPSCPTGYRLTAPLCVSGGQTLTLLAADTSGAAANEKGTCDYFNVSQTTTFSAQAGARCCRVPGR